MKDRDGREIFIGDLVMVPGLKGPVEVYGGNFRGTELWYYDYVAGRFDGVDPKLAARAVKSHSPSAR